MSKKPNNTKDRDELDNYIDDRFKKALIEFQFAFDEIDARKKWYSLAPKLELTERDKIIGKGLFNKGFKAGVDKMIEIYNGVKNG